jgi:uncharacterized membrane protein
LVYRYKIEVDTFDLIIKYPEEFLPININSISLGFYSLNTIRLMNKRLVKWVRGHYDNIVSSIAFYPVIIAVLFLIFSWLMLKFDSSTIGKEFKESIDWLSLRDADTAREITSIIVGSIITLTVFSFSMVMIVLVQAGAQMSNRVLNSMIEDRYQQVVLGFYIGSATYGLFLLSTIQDIDSGVNVPAISIYLLIFLTIVDIFLFIYFLDFVTRGVMYETVIHRVKSETMSSMEKHYTSDKESVIEISEDRKHVIGSEVSGYFQGYDKVQLVKLAKKHAIKIRLLIEVGDYVIKGADIVWIYGETSDIADLRNDLYWIFDFYNGQPIENHPFYGFRHLTEVAVKALSPNNDPATAVLCLNAMSAMFNYHLDHFMPSVLKDQNQQERVLLKTTLFKDMFRNSIYPIWQYGKDDRYVQIALVNMLEQLIQADKANVGTDVFKTLMAKTQKKVEESNFF